MKPTTTTTTRRHRQGASLVEMAIAVAVASISIGSAVPPLQALIQRHQIEGTTAQLRTDLRWMRSLAIARNQSLRISFTKLPQAACYVIHTGAAKDCPCDAEGEPVCQNGAEALRSVAFPAGGAVTVSSNSASMLVDAGHGTFTPTGSVKVRGRNGRELKLIVNILGRARVCAQGAGLPGHPNC
ncbi:MAG: GspH/FimT family pseudopilin [Burkholderiales bacterium]|nr:GspH/FimT family pseudopilin [Burkholderiales bacterium]MDE1926660.1 GspH/FimT family pseudopilin [Burkholderiales bacterium]MDE2158699.1 GspH/FimT family pseudopilin [Burkholderiales bacterium]MDE2503959.1 GspH/FimT family pseudopilin [Burkholderiales bacterium]